MAGTVGWLVSARSIGDWSLLFGSSQKLGRSCLCSAVLSLRWIESADVPQCRHLQMAVGRSASHEVEMYLLPPCFTRILIICCCFYRFFKERIIASSRSPDRRDQADAFYVPSRSERLYDLAPDIQDAMELWAPGPNAKLVKTMSVRDSQCIRLVTPDDHVGCGFNGILLHEMEEVESPFVATSKLDYLRGNWPRVLLAFMTRYQQELGCKHKECKERFGCTQLGNCKHCGRYIWIYFGKYISFGHLELVWLCCCVAMWCTMWKGTARDCRDLI